ncbi:hypothetical protein OBBRIDRAFT_378631 [Obba rivulosa]|uniref:Galactose oxidase n=1 Tax=Obba rivulosa TaxID=1052685 RepID=A0A8E2B3K0_9APHY|nr:hypothetical protein OBBRIDRAFT_378631 [Obba rivulosa]
MSQSAVLRVLTVLYLIHDSATAQYTAIPRWGQAAALVGDTLYVQGGRTEEFNSWAYTSAPVSNDLISLSLSSSFNTSLPPWNYLSGCSNCSPQQGPAVSWHTLSAFNTSTLLLFGGDLGPNSSIPVPEEADSAALLNVGDSAEPQWTLEGQGWGSEPLRRMFHSASSSGGKIWLVGGEKTDGSNTALSDHYVFDPTAPSFTQLPSTNGPPDIYGHQSAVLSNGWLLVFGGFSQSENSLIPLTTIWAMDTTSSSLGWATLSVSNASVPSPRRGFAAALMDDDKVVIHGGADAALQTSYDDGWVLDTTQSPMVWSSVSALSQLGSRRDHLAVAKGSQVIFGFGYETNGPAPADLLVFDFSTNSLVSSFTPPSSVSGTPSNTVPGPSPTGSSGASTPSSGSGSGSGSGQNPSGTGYHPGSGTQTTAGGTFPSSSSGGGNGNGSNGTGGGPGSTVPSSGISGHHDDVTIIALGTVFGVLGVLVGATAAAWYVRRHHGSRDSFHVLGDTDDEDSGHLGASIPVAGTKEKHFAPTLLTVRTRLSGLVPGRAVPQQQQRRDMLADEDTRHFGLPTWYTVRREASSGQSSWSSARTVKRPSFGDVMHESLASLKSIGGAMFGYAASTRVPMSREGSAGSRSAGWWEKEPSYEPFADDMGLVRSQSASHTASRPRGGRQPSYATVRSGPYVDPFDDYVIESFRMPGEDSEEDSESDDGGLAVMGLPSLRDPPPRPYSFLEGSAGREDVNQLSTISELPSVPTLSTLIPSSDSSHATPPLSSRSSQEISRSPRLRPSSILDANSPPGEPMRRSNSWWTRFAKTPLLDRRSSESGRVQRPLEFRDPNPPPRLVPIEESAQSQSQSPDTPESRRRDRQMYTSGHHRRSTTSLQTAQTADSEMIEKMGRTFDIVQKDTISSHASGPSTSSAGGDSPEAELPQQPEGQPYIFTPSGGPKGHDDGGGRDFLVQSPTQMTAADGSDLASPLAYQPMTPPRRPQSGGRVAARVQDFERRVSQQEEPPSLPPPPRAQRSRATSVYGLAPKSPLFVANPDHKHLSSSSSS